MTSKGAAGKAYYNNIWSVAFLAHEREIVVAFRRRMAAAWKHPKQPDVPRRR